MFRQTRLFVLFVEIVESHFAELLVHFSVLLHVVWLVGGPEREGVCLVGATRLKLVFNV